jgi:glycosyl transferase family 2
VPRFTVLLPVHRPPATLPYAIQTVLAQTLGDLELFVICDGAPETTIGCAEEYAARDSRVTVLAYPKGERVGEAYRHLALGRAGSDYVAQISDDDLWFPEHLAELAVLLGAVDFGHAVHTQVRPDGAIEALPPNLEDPALRDQLLRDNTLNRFGPTFAGYRLDAYRRLPEGWAPAPQTVQTDLHMWRKFLRCPGLHYGARMAITALHFPTRERGHMSLEERAHENQRWHARVRDPHERNMIVQMAWRSLVGRTLRLERECVRITGLHAAARAELARLTEARAEAIDELNRTAAANRRMETTLRAVLHSKSWRMTAPLRAVLTVAQRLRPKPPTNDPAAP